MIIVGVFNTASTHRHLIIYTVMGEELVVVLADHVFNFVYIRSLIESGNLVILTSWQSHMFDLARFTKQCALASQTLEECKSNLAHSRDTRLASWLSRFFLCVELILQFFYFDHFLVHKFVRACYLVHIAALRAHQWFNSFLFTPVVIKSFYFCNFY